MFTYTVHFATELKGQQAVDAFEASGDNDALKVAKVTFARFPADDLELRRGARIVHRQAGAHGAPRA